jgi:anti-sigma factor RsiW
MSGIRDEKVVAGLSCSEVLARLSDYLDGDLPDMARGQLEDHLRGCDSCARFGGEFQTTIRALRVHLGASGGIPPALRLRLRRALNDET